MTVSGPVISGVIRKGWFEPWCTASSWGFILGMGPPPLSPALSEPLSLAASPDTTPGKAVCTRKGQNSLVLWHDWHSCHSRGIFMVYGKDSDVRSEQWPGHLQNAIRCSAYPTMFRIGLEPWKSGGKFLVPTALFHILLVLLVTRAGQWWWLFLLKRHMSVCIGAGGRYRDYSPLSMSNASILLSGRPWQGWGQWHERFLKGTRSKYSLKSFLLILPFCLIEKLNLWSGHLLTQKGWLKLWEEHESWIRHARIWILLYPILCAMLGQCVLSLLLYEMSW